MQRNLATSCLRKSPDKTLRKSLNDIQLAPENSGFNMVRGVQRDGRVGHGRVRQVDRGRDSPDRPGRVYTNSSIFL